MEDRAADRTSDLSPPRFGLFLNMGARLMERADDVFAFTLEQAELAERLGYHDLWVTEHHFIPFGLNPSALTAASFLLGRTRRTRVGTAVALSPLHHPVALAEKALLLSQLSGGRFDLGVGRGGYLRDYEVLGVDTARWDIEPEATVEVLLRAFAGEPVRADTPWFSFDDVRIEPPPPAGQAPGLFVATRSEQGIALAARHGLPLQHYFAVPPEPRRALEDGYRAALPAGEAPPDHLHTLIALVTDDPDGTRARLHESLTASFEDGDWPMVPQANRHHTDAQGRTLSRKDQAEYVAKGALLGPPDVLAGELASFLEATGARRVALFMEAIADPELTLQSIERFATEVVPRLQESPR